MFRELDRYRQGLAEYIEATYHASNPTLVELRRDLLRRPGMIAQRPYLESAARYVAGAEYQRLAVSAPVRELLQRLSTEEGGGLLFNPPYLHQAEALEAALGPRRADLLVTTGTGSGKTETFLLPLLGRLYEEAALRPASFKARGLRAIILYPMNALVNDQLGRLRALFGAPVVREAFTRAAGRPVKLARYTGRTLYPGVRGKDRDIARLKPLTFYTGLLERAARGELAATALVERLAERGKWPAKPDLLRWYWGTDSRRRWEDDDHNPLRAVELEEDVELLTRHEVHASVPDLLMTNYSMLEYTLLRPLERPIWRQAAQFFATHPDERLTLVLDEAHLYRGASGTEVALLLRRLRQRLALEPERLQVMCTSASFSDPDAAVEFAAGLSGKTAQSFVIPDGRKRATTPSGPGSDGEASALATVDLGALHQGDPLCRLRAVLPVLSALEATRVIARSQGSTGGARLELCGLHADGKVGWRDVPISEPGEWVAVCDARLCANPPDLKIEIALEGAPPVFSLHEAEVKLLWDPIAAPLARALRRWPVTGRLINLTSGAEALEDPATAPGAGGSAQELAALGEKLFEGWGDEGRRRAATDALVELAALARDAPADPPLLPARAHVFFRGLPGLWACVDTECKELAEEQRGGPTGALYAQPRDRCRCGARVLELHTCRGCGIAVAIGYSPEPQRPTYLWGAAGGGFDDAPRSLPKVHLVLEEPGAGVHDEAQVAWLDPESGRLGSESERAREVWITAPQAGAKQDKAGCFERCPRCGGPGESISDHQTKGDQPFQELVSTQLLEQPPRPESTTPLKGRKVLIFSDGRQAASRLSGKLKDLSLRDATRPLVLDGYRALRDEIKVPCTLDHAYEALLIGCARRGVTLRPAGDEAAALFKGHLELARATWEGADRSPARLAALGSRVRAELPRLQDVLTALLHTLTSPYYGLEPLGLAAFVGSPDRLAEESFGALTAPPGAGTEAERRQALLDRWVQLAVRAGALKLEGTPAEWVDAREGARVRRIPGHFPTQLKADLGAVFHRDHLASRAGVARPWLAWLVAHMRAGDVTANGMLVSPAQIRLRLQDEVSWVRCRRCTQVQARNPVCSRCVECRQDALEPLDVQGDPAFIARAAYHRHQAQRCLEEPSYAPHPFVAEEHSAAISAAVEGEVFSRTERYELRFQDLDPTGESESAQGPVDVLSCTTTMEVGIDIGSLTGVALRNVPPGRANYQQRAGRAGRRGSSLATVITFANAESHDQRFFNDPAAMVSGPVVDPRLNLNNVEIVERHAFALLLSQYQQEVVPESTALGGHLFMSLGPLKGFRAGSEDDHPSFRGLEAWLQVHEDVLIEALDALVPQEVEESVDRAAFVRDLPARLIARLTREALAGPVDVDEEDDPVQAAAAEEDELGPALVDPDVFDPFDDVMGDREARSAGREAAEAQAPFAEDGAGAESPEDPLNEELVLDRLFAKAILPRYAFPTDVVTFSVFDESKTNRFGRPVVRYSPQQGMSAALSQYSPGRAVWVDGIQWQSMAIWTPYARDRIRAHRAYELFYECSSCSFVEVIPAAQGHEGQTRDCPACRGPGALGPAMKWFRPPGFAHPVDLPALTAAVADRPLTRPSRAKLSVPTIPDGEQHRLCPTVVAWIGKADLTVTNSGADERGDRRDQAGFLYCTACGRAEPAGWREGQLHSSTHSRPTPRSADEASDQCTGRRWVVALGHRFRTDVALLRFSLGGGVRLVPGTVTTRVAMTTLAEALAEAARRLLELDADGIGAEWRPAQTEAGHRGEEVEVYLHDTVPGGAGYAGMAARHVTPTLLEEALEVLKGCRARCDRSCYECLRGYQNRWLHDDLDRRTAADLLQHCLHGSTPQVDPEVGAPLLQAMAGHLRDDGHAAEVEGLCLRIDGARRVALTHPLTPDAAVPSGWVAVPQMMAQRALPNACLVALGAAEGPATSRPARPELIDDPAGTPVFALSALAEGWGRAPAPIARVRAPHGAGPDDFIVRLDGNMIERHRDQAGRSFHEGAWLLCRRAPAAAAGRDSIERGVVYLVARSTGAFQASRARWTMGTLRWMTPIRGGAEVKVAYLSPRRDCRYEIVKADQVNLLGTVLRVVES